jgi:GTP:adenosylcobinamide-phosphate guanylyltransferase
LSVRPTEALILAGSRGGRDPVAAAAGLAHKAVVPVGGVPMLLRVVRTLLASGAIARIHLCIDQATLAGGLGAELDALIAAGKLVPIAPAASPSESVIAALDAIKEPWPLLVTTADHALLTPAMVEHFCAHMPADADLALGLAEASLIRASYPDAIRTFYRFAGKGYSGCNLFLLKSPKVRGILEFWRAMERHRKRPWRLVAAVGPLVLLRFVLGRLSLEQALDHLSSRTGTRIRPVLLPFAEAAIDVDKPSDLALAEAILGRRGRAGDQAMPSEA